MEQVIDAIAAYRVTRLLQQDDLPQTVAIREAIRDGDSPWWVKELYACPWCLGFWVSLGVVVLRKSMPRAWSLVGSALAASAVVGWLRAADRAHQRWEDRL